MIKYQVLRLALLFAFIVPCTAQPPRKLIVVSVDGLDWRYLRDRDALHLRIPSIRHLLQNGRYAGGVIGVWPTITWPSHTSLITGVRPDQHGIEGNRRPKSEGGDYYWSVNLLKSPALWKLAHDHGRTTAAITWPVTVGAPIDYNLPEYFHRRQGGSMDLESISSQATPGLAAEIAKAYPSFPQQWMDDRTRTLAALFLLHEKKPDLLLMHLVDLDAEEHEQGPYTENANAVVERTDELIGSLLKALPPDYDFALVSDHGFERVDKIANPRVLLAQNHLPDDVESLGGILTTNNEAVAQFLRTAPEGIGPEIPKSELHQYAPNLENTIAAFQPADHVLFGTAAQGPYFTPPAEKGNHGFWPARHDYRSVFCLYGPGIPPGQLGEIQMLTIAARLAAVLGLSPQSTVADDYLRQLKQLDDSRPESVCIARAYLRRFIPESSIGQRDKMFRAFRNFDYDSASKTATAFMQLMNKYTADYEKRFIPSAPNDFGRKLLTGRPDIAAAGARWFQCGFLIYDSEGSLYPRPDPAALLEFASQLSPDLGSYLRFRAAEDPQRVVDDAAIEISWEELRLRLERWEAFARDHPDLPETKSEIQPAIQALAQLYLFGASNTPSFYSGSGQIDPSLLASWSQFVLLDRASHYYPLVSLLAHNRTIRQQDRPLFAKFGLAESFDQCLRSLQFLPSGR